MVDQGNLLFPVREEEVGRITPRDWHRRLIFRVVGVVECTAHAKQKDGRGTSQDEGGDGPKAEAQGGVLGCRFRGRGAEEEGLLDQGAAQAAG